MVKLAHHRRRHAVETWLGIYEERLKTCQATVNVGLVTLIFKVAHVAHALDNKLCVVALGKIDGEV